MQGISSVSEQWFSLIRFIYFYEQNGDNSIGKCIVIIFDRVILDYLRNIRNIHNTIFGKFAGVILPQWEATIPSSLTYMISPRYSQ